MAKDIKNLSVFIMKFRHKISTKLKTHIKEQLTKQIERNFNRESNIGEKWQSLSPSTKKTRKFKGKPILQQTGRLKSSIKTMIRNNRIKVKSVYYGRFHQEGTNKMPARPFANMKEFKYIAKWLVDIWKKG